MLPPFPPQPPNLLFFLHAVAALSESACIPPGSLRATVYPAVYFALLLALLRRMLSSTIFFSLGMAIRCQGGVNTLRLRKEAAPLQVTERILRPTEKKART